MEAIEDVHPLTHACVLNPGTRARYTLQCTVQSTVVPAIEDMLGLQVVLKPATCDESTVVEQGKAGKGVEKGTAGNAVAVAETPWPLFDAAAHRAAVDKDKFTRSGWSWTVSAGYGSSTSSSSGWNQGWYSRSNWQSGWRQ